MIKSASKLFTLLTLAIFSTVVVVGISYYTVQQFMFAGDRIFYGKKQSDLAAEIGSELLRRNDVSQVSIDTEDGMKLSALLFKRNNAKANLVLCHGYKGSKEFMYAYINLFKDFNILLFDFRAHGKSTGYITSLGCHEYKDVIAASNFLRKQTPSQKIPLILLGISMGGASCLKAMEVNSSIADCMIIDSTFSNLEKMFLRGYYLRVKLPYYPFFPVIRGMFHYFGRCDIKKMSTTECVKSIKNPILFIHSCTDTFITPENSVQLYAHAQHKRTRLWIGPKCRHGWLHTYHPKLYKKKVDKFLGKTIFKK